MHGLPTSESLPWVEPWSLELEAKLSGAAITSRLKAQLNGHEGSVLTAVFNRDGTRILTVGGTTGSVVSPDKTARLWDGERGTEIAMLKGHEGSVLCAVFSPDGTRILTCSQDKTARLWDAMHGTPIHVFRGHSGFVPGAYSAKEIL